MAATITWQQLRKLAESVHGQDSRELGIRLDAQKGEFIAEPLEASRQTDYILQVSPKPQPMKQGQMKVLLPGIKKENLRVQPVDDDFFPIADAVFWSASAVQKFLVPYYASFLELDEVMQKIVKEFARPDVLAFVHLPNSEVFNDGAPDSPLQLFSVREDGGPAGGFKLMGVL